MDKLRVLFLAISFCLSVAPTCGQTTPTNESIGTPAVGEEDVSRPPMAAKQADGESAFKAWDKYARDITAALDANDVTKAEACAAELKSEAKKANTHAAMAIMHCAYGWIQAHNRQ